GRAFDVEFLRDLRELFLLFLVELGDRVELAAGCGRRALAPCGRGGGCATVRCGTVRGGAVRRVRGGGFFGGGGVEGGGVWVVQAGCSVLRLPAGLSPRALASWVRGASSG